MKSISFKNVVWKEEDQYVSWNLNTGVSSFGNTKKEALEMLHEALELYLENAPVSAVQKVERPDVVSLVLKHA